MAKPTKATEARRAPSLGKTARSAAARPSRRRAAATAVADKPQQAEPDATVDDDTRRRHVARQIEQLAILTLAIVVGVVGLAWHGLWVLSLILMTLLWGFMAATVKGRRSSGGLVSNLVTAVVDEVHDVAKDATITPSDGR